MCVFTVASLQELARGDLGVGQPARGEREDLALALGEVAVGGGTGRGAASAKCAKSSRVADAAITADPACTVRIAASRNSGSASFSRNPLAPCRIARAAASSRSKVVSMTMRGGSLVAQQLGGRREAVHHRHPDVHQHDVGARRADDRERLAAVGCLADDLEVGLGVDQHADAGPEQRLVVDEHHPDRRASSRRCRSRSGCVAAHDEVAADSASAVERARRRAARARACR